MFSKLLNKFKTWRQEYKIENEIFKQFEEPEPKWEKRLSLFIFLIVIGLMLLQLFLIEIKHLSGILAIIFALIALTYGNQAKREFKAAKRYYAFKKECFPLKNQKRTIVTSIFFAKVVKPAVVFCVKCGATGLSLNFAYGEIFGFSPLNEVGRSIAGLQSWSQTFSHTIHPLQYYDLPDSPIVQDLRVDNLSKDEIIRNKDEVIRALEEKLSKKK